MMVQWQWVVDDLEPQLEGALQELESPKCDHERTQYLRGLVSAYKFALELPERRERLERGAEQGSAEFVVS